MTDLVTQLTFKPPRLIRESGRLQTVATFTLGELVEIRGLISEDDTGAACFFWPSARCRGGCWVKTVRLCDIGDRDSVEKTILDGYRAGRISGELPGVAVMGKGNVYEREKLSLKEYLDGLRRGRDWSEQLNLLSPGVVVRICKVQLSLSGIGSDPIPARDSEILGVLERQFLNLEKLERRQRKRPAAKAVAPIPAPEPGAFYAVTILQKLATGKAIDPFSIPEVPRRDVN